jgi:hypothetical protein
VSATVVMKSLTPVPFPSFLSSRHGTLVKETTRHVCIAIAKNKEAHRALKTFFPPELPFLTVSHHDPVMPFPRPQPHTRLSILPYSRESPPQTPRVCLSREELLRPLSRAAFSPRFVQIVPKNTPFLQHR